MQGILLCTKKYHYLAHHSPQQLQKLGEALDNTAISKAEIGWDLNELETAAKLVSLTI